MSIFSSIFWIAILAVLGAVVAFAMNVILADYLETHILDFVADVDAPT